MRETSVSDSSSCSSVPCASWRLGVGGALLVRARIRKAHRFAFFDSHHASEVEILTPEVWLRSIAVTILDPCSHGVEVHCNASAYS